LYADVDVREEHTACSFKVDMYGFRNRLGYIRKLEGVLSCDPRGGHKYE
jgi:hypothetical protein